jgi:DNA-damage-inducible protein J
MTDRINTRIDPQLKAEAEAVLAQLGMNSADYVRLMYRQLVMRQGLPFDVKIPNAETRAAMAEDVSANKRYAARDIGSVLDEL